MDIKTLQFWHKIEHFYPYILTEQNDESIHMNYINKASHFLEIQNTKPKKGKEIACFAVYFGLFKVDSALNVIDERLNHKPQFKDESDEESCFCSFKLFSNGVFDSSSFKISSFPWAIQRIKEGKINLDYWEEDFKHYQIALLTTLNNQKSKIDYEFLESFKREITESINWDIEFSVNWMRVDVVFRDERKETTEIGVTVNEEDEEDERLKIEELLKANELLNSFYVKDLEKVIESCKNEQLSSNNALYQYLRMASEQRHDLEQEEEILFRIYDPKHLPYVRWPSEYNLRAMQQVAVNLFLSKDLMKKQIFSVNGPPGTGKTTLLKDIIAGIIFERALHLSKLKQPDDAFGEECYKFKYSNSAGTPFSGVVRKLKDEYKNYGILVASNNNAAVKNITTELPDKKAIPSVYADTYAYFNQLSDYVLGKETWGMIAAALGNKKNCSSFIDKFWPLSKKDDDSLPFDFNKYLRSLKKADGQQVESWERAVNSFENTLKEVQSEYEKMEKIFLELKEIRADQKKIDLFESERMSLEEQLHFEKGNLLKLDREYNEVEALLLSHKERLEVIEKQKPFIKLTSRIAILKNGAVNKKYLEIKESSNKSLLRMVDIKFEKSRQDRELVTLEESHKLLFENIESLKKSISDIEVKLSIYSEENRTRPSALGETFGCILPKETYHSGLISEDEQERASHQKQVPWNYEKLDQLREKLFLEALKLHKSFVENSKEIRTNLDEFNKMLRGILSKEDTEKHSGELFQSFFFVVPVVSTTFASVGRFLKHIGKNEIGYLLIDEAGQAVPQSAVGAIWRSKKVIAVGDPLQIAPVVTLHDKVIEYLKAHYKQTTIIGNKETSVQYLADLSNDFGSKRKVDEENEIWVGTPLLVHGRCRKHIFDLSNGIAYNNKMIYDTNDSNIEAVCKWIDIKGAVENGHFVRAQVKAIEKIVIDAFLETYESNLKSELPELFIITPFKSVRAGIIKYFKEEKYLFVKLLQLNIHVDEKQVKNWISKNIGTIHTFQGKEAKKVIICLGGDSYGKSTGAIEWASRTPNLLNVAITRAKHELYIVGDVNCWKNKKYFSEAYKKCTEVG